MAGGSEKFHGSRDFKKTEAVLLVPVFLFTFSVYYLLHQACIRVFQTAGIAAAGANDIPGDKAGLILYFLINVPLTAVLEELFFRKAIMSSLNRYGKCFSAAVSSLIFAASHWQAVRILPVFVWGLVLALTYLITGDLSAPEILHVLNNTLAFILLAVYGRCGEKTAAALVTTILVLGGVSFLALLSVLPRLSLSVSESEEGHADRRELISVPFITAAAAYAAIIIFSCGVVK